MTDHPRLTRYIPFLNGTTFMGMLRQNDTYPELFGPSYDPTHGPYVLAAEADAEIERLRAEVERLTHEDAAARSDIEMLLKSRDVLLQEVERLRAALEEIGGYDCENYCKHLSPQPCGGCITCIARAALTADPPHCPTCGCGAESPTSPAPQS